MVQWTPKQLEAIETTGSDILVAAAAGSGKTTVLVERIIQKIVRGEYKIDEVLVSTFTNASARDMKEKIERALRKKYEETGEPRLYEEMINLKEAHISTLHSFCLYLIRMHYNAVGISPDMRTLSDVEMKIRLDGTISRTLETYYQSDDDNFHDLSKMLSSDKSNDGMVNEIRNIYYTAVASPKPEQFLLDIKDQYINDDRLSEILNAFNQMTGRKLKALMNDLDTMRTMYQTVTHDDIKDTQVRDAFDALETLTKSVLNAVELNRNNTPVSLIPFALKDGRHNFYKKIADESEKEALKAVHNRVKTRYSEVYQMPKYDLERVRAELSPMNGMNNVLVDIALQVLTSFKAQKFERNEMDFSDYEHYALDILNADGGQIKHEYQSQFKEIMIDEYQDINRVQEAIITSLKSGGESDGNLFMVGDVKQSIYKFRQADPSLFIEKSKRFTKSKSGHLINLNHNFRSRGEVLSLTNQLFERIMDEEVGEIIYDDNHKLVQGNYLSESPVLQEVHVIEEADSLIDNPEIRHIVEEIKKKVNDGVSFNDIVILTRNSRDNEMYRKLLSAEDLPVYVNNRSGYLDTLEIRTMLSILSVIDNPLQDDHLVGMMRLPMFDFTEDMIAKIRAADDSVYLYEALMRYDGEEIIKAAIKTFRQALSLLIRRARYLSVPELIDDIFYEFNLLEYFSGLPGGVSRRANLNGLVEKAVEFEGMSHLSLYEFISFIHQMIEDGQDFGEENTVTEDDDTLRVMTIHASKGLEFKYVIYAGLYRNLNLRDVTNKVIVHPDAGIAFKRFLPESSVVLPSIHQIVLAGEIKKEMISEEMRLIYVAMTRAVDQLIMPFVFKGEYKEKYHYEGGMVLADNRLNIQSVQDLMLPVLAYLSEQPDNETFVLKYIESVDEKVSAGRHIHTLNDLSTAPVPENKVIEEKLLYQYPNAEETEVVHKESVSEMKRRNEPVPEDSYVVRHERAPELNVPNFMNTGVDAPIFGTLMHEVMVQVVHRFHTIKGMEEAEQSAYLNHLVHKKMQGEAFVTEEHINQMLENIRVFMAEPLMRSLLDKAKNIHTEIPFIMNQKSIGYSKYSAQIVQGIMDCLIETDDGYVIIDYKTDQVKARQLTRDDLLNRYYSQMDIYKRSAEKALQKDVTVYLYFFDYGAIEVE